MRKTHTFARTALDPERIAAFVQNVWQFPM